jgi:hypothetical protein
VPVVRVYLRVFPSADGALVEKVRSTVYKHAALVGVLFVSLCAAAFAADKASLVFVDGEVTLDGAAAVVGEEVKAGSTIQTGPDSSCDLVFNTRNVLHVAAGTILTFDPGALSRGVTLRKGAVAMVLRNLAARAGGDLRFTVRTPTTVAGVRGTCFLGSVEDEDHTYVCCCNGSVRLEGADGSFSQNIAASHHREIRVTREGGGLSAAAAPMLYHTDKDVEAVASRIGESVDWTRLER